MTRNDKIDEYNELEQKIRVYNKDRNEILEGLKPYNQNALVPLIVEYDNLIETVRAGFYIQYSSLPTESQEVDISYAVLDSMMQRYIK